MATQNWITEAELKALMDKAEDPGIVGKHNMIFHPNDYKRLQDAGIIDHDGYWVMPPEEADNYE